MTASDCYISVLRCPQHGFVCIALEDESGSGRRLRGAKCCGSWVTVNRWPAPKALEYDKERAAVAYKKPRKR